MLNVTTSTRSPSSSPKLPKNENTEIESGSELFQSSSSLTNIDNLEAPIDNCVNIMLNIEQLKPNNLSFDKFIGYFKDYIKQLKSYEVVVDKTSEIIDVLSKITKHPSKTLSLMDNGFKANLDALPIMLIACLKESKSAPICDFNKILEFAKDNEFIRNQANEYKLMDGYAFRLAPYPFAAELGGWKNVKEVINLIANSLSINDSIKQLKDEKINAYRFMMHFKTYSAVLNKYGISQKTAEMIDILTQITEYSESKTSKVRVVVNLELDALPIMMIAYLRASTPPNFCDIGKILEFAQGNNFIRDRAIEYEPRLETTDLLDCLNQSLGGRFGGESGIGSVINQICATKTTTTTNS